MKAKLSVFCLFLLALTSHSQAMSDIISVRSVRTSMINQIVGQTVQAMIHGDFNGDGIADIAVSAAGTVVVGYGHTDLSSKDFIHAKVFFDPLYNEEPKEKSSFGSTLYAGDYNHDGCDELFITDPRTGTVYVKYGTATPWGLESDPVSSLRYNLLENIDAIIKPSGSSKDFGMGILLANFSGNSLKELLISDSSSNKINIFKDFDLNNPIVFSNNGLMDFKDVIGDTNPDLIISKGSLIGIIDSTTLSTLDATTGMGNTFNFKYSYTFQAENLSDVINVKCADFLGDSKQDLLVGSPMDGKIFVIKGSSALSGNSTSYDLCLQDSNKDNFFGSSFELSDVNNDGAIDISVYKQHEGENDISFGIVNVYSGFNFKNLEGANNISSFSPYLVFKGEEEGQTIGAIHGYADFNNDMIMDFYGSLYFEEFAIISSRENPYPKISISNDVFYGNSTFKPIFIAEHSAGSQVEWYVNNAIASTQGNVFIPSLKPGKHKVQARAYLITNPTFFRKSSAIEVFSINNPPVPRVTLSNHFVYERMPLTINIGITEIDTDQTLSVTNVMINGGDYAGHVVALSSNTFYLQFSPSVSGNYTVVTTVSDGYNKNSVISKFVALDQFSFGNYVFGKSSYNVNEAFNFNVKFGSAERSEFQFLVDNAITTVSGASPQYSVVNQSRNSQGNLSYRLIYESGNANYNYSDVFPVMNNLNSSDIHSDVVKFAGYVIGPSGHSFSPTITVGTESLVSSPFTIVADESKSFVKNHADGSIDKVVVSYDVMNLTSSSANNYTLMGENFIMSGNSSFIYLSPSNSSLINEFTLDNVSVTSSPISINQVSHESVSGNFTDGLHSVVAKGVLSSNLMEVASQQFYVGRIYSDTDSSINFDKSKRIHAGDSIYFSIATKGTPSLTINGSTVNVWTTSANNYEARYSVPSSGTYSVNLISSKGPVQINQYRSFVADNLIDRGVFAFEPEGFTKGTTTTVSVSSKDFTPVVDLNGQTLQSDSVVGSKYYYKITPDSINSLGFIVAIGSRSISMNFPVFNTPSTFEIPEFSVSASNQRLQLGETMTIEAINTGSILYASYAVVNGYSLSSISVTSGRKFSFTPSQADLGLAAILVTFKDPYNSSIEVNKSIFVNVVVPNNKPEIILSKSRPTGRVGEPLTLTFTINDLDEDDLIESQLYVGTDLVPLDGTPRKREFVFDPKEAGIQHFKFVANDGKEKVVHEFDLESVVNTPPTFVVALKTGVYASPVVGIPFTVEVRIKDVDVYDTHNVEMFFDESLVYLSGNSLTRSIEVTIEEVKTIYFYCLVTDYLQSDTKRFSFRVLLRNGVAVSSIDDPENETIAEVVKDFGTHTSVKDASTVIAGMTQSLSSQDMASSLYSFARLAETGEGVSFGANNTYVDILSTTQDGNVLKSSDPDMPVSASGIPGGSTIVMGSIPIKNEGQIGTGKLLSVDIFTGDQQVQKGFEIKIVRENVYNQQAEILAYVQSKDVVGNIVEEQLNGNQSSNGDLTLSMREESFEQIEQKFNEVKEVVWDDVTIEDQIGQSWQSFKPRLDSSSKTIRNHVVIRFETKEKTSTAPTPIEVSPTTGRPISEIKTTTGGGGGCLLK